MKKGLTMMEILIAMAILVVVLAVSLVALNPVGQVKRARNSQRTLHINAILNSVRANIADTRTGVFTCVNGNVPTSTKRMATGVGNYDIGNCLVPTYLQILPFDPSASSSYFNSLGDYNTGYDILRNASTGAITVLAPFAELGKTILVTF